MGVRSFTTADIDGVAEVHVRAWQAAYAGIVPADYLASLDPAKNAARRRAWKAQPGQHTLVMETAAGTIAGFVSFGPSLDDDDPAAGQLYAIYVLPGQWGRGIGRELFESCRAGLTRAGCSRMRLWVLEENAPTRRFYERMGLAPDGARDTYTPPGTTVELPQIRYAGAL